MKHAVRATKQTARIGSNVVTRGVHSSHHEGFVSGTEEDHWIICFFAGGAHAKERLLKTCRVLYHWRQIGFSSFSDLEHDRRAAKTFFSFFQVNDTLARNVIAAFKE